MKQLDKMSVRALYEVSLFGSFSNRIGTLITVISHGKTTYEELLTVGIIKEAYSDNNRQLRSDIRAARLAGLVDSERESGRTRYGITNMTREIRDRAQSIMNKAEEYDSLPYQLIIQGALDETKSHGLNPRPMISVSENARYAEVSTKEGLVLVFQADKKDVTVPHLEEVKVGNHKISIKDNSLDIQKIAATEVRSED